MTATLYRRALRLPRRSDGFSITELLVVVAVLAVVTAVGAPSFSSAAAARRLDSTTAQLAAAIRLARSEAVKRAAVTVVEPLESAGWSGSLRVYAALDMDPSGTMRADDVLIRIFDARSGIDVARGAPAKLAFDAKGRHVRAQANGAPTRSTIVLCASSIGRTFTVDFSGTPALQPDEPC